jgi:hypothetical protein
MLSNHSQHTNKNTKIFTDSEIHKFKHRHGSYLDIYLHTLLAILERWFLDISTTSERECPMSPTVKRYCLPLQSSIFHSHPPVLKTQSKSQNLQLQSITRTVPKSDHLFSKQLLPRGSCYCQSSLVL